MSARPCCIRYTNSSRRRVLVYLIQHGRECCKCLKKRTILYYICLYLRSNFQNKRCLNRENQSQSLCKSREICFTYIQISWTYARWFLERSAAYKYTLSFFYTVRSDICNCATKIKYKQFKCHIILLNELTCNPAWYFTSFVRIFPSPGFYYYMRKKWLLAIKSRIFASSKPEKALKSVIRLFCVKYRLRFYVFSRPYLVKFVIVI